MNTESAECRRVKVPLAEGQATEPGDFAWSFDSDELDTGDGRAWIYLHLPGDSSWCAIEVRKGTPGGPRVWGWDGDADRPTLTPSILHAGHWHGHLVKGKLKSC